MSKILLAGGFGEPVAADSSLRGFIRALAAEIVTRGHALLGGCQTTLDAEAAAAAKEALALQGKQPDNLVEGSPPQTLLWTTDLAVAGDSGAPIPDVQGRVVGMLAAGRTGPEAQSISIPVETIRSSFFEDF